MDKLVNSLLCARSPAWASLVKVQSETYRFTPTVKSKEPIITATNTKRKVRFLPDSLRVAGYAEVHVVNLWVVSV